MQLWIVVIAYLLVHLLDSLHQNAVCGCRLLGENLAGELDAVHGRHLSSRVHKLYQVLHGTVRLFHSGYLLHVWIKLFVDRRKLFQTACVQVKAARDLFYVQNCRWELRNVYELQGCIRQVVVLFVRVHIDLLVFQKLLVGVFLGWDKFVREFAIKQLLQRVDGEVEQVKLFVRCPEELKLLQRNRKP